MSTEKGDKKKSTPFIDPLNPEESGKILQNVKKAKRKGSYKCTFIGNQLFIYPWTAFHSVLRVMDNIYCQKGC